MADTRERSGADERTPTGATVTEAVRARLAEGLDRRTHVPIEAHASVPEPDDRDDPLALLTAQDTKRLPLLVPIRHARMGATPFTFYRGAAAVMASDLARVGSTGLRVQLCGDAHLMNFGVFKGPDRRLVFDLNDFDETLPGPFEWDLKRLVASVTIAGRNNDLSAKQIRSVTRAASRGYRTALRTMLTKSPLDLHYFRIEIADLDADGEPLHKRARKAIEKAASKDSMRALVKLTEVVDGRRRIMADPPLIIPLTERLEGDADELRAMYDRYRSTLAPHRSAVLDGYRFVDIAHKVVGVGSVGTRCLIALFESDDGSPLFLQLKEATQSVLEPYAGRSEYARPGERVVRGQRLMQTAGDILLGWAHLDRPGDDPLEFYFRQLWDGKGSADVDRMGPKRLKRYASACGATLALAHARTGDGAAIAGYLGEWCDDGDAQPAGRGLRGRDVDDVFVEFAERYADLNEGDHAAHAAAIAAGTIAAAETV